MRLRVLELPDDPAELAPWLDRQLVGLDLAALVAELEAVHARSAADSPPDLDAVLSDRLSAVLRRGLSAAPRPVLGTLLRNPRLLLVIQERVLVEGGSYWNDLVRRDAKVARHVEADWPGVEQRTRALASAPASQGAAQSIPFEPLAAARPPARVGLLRAWAVIATVAASALAMLIAAERFNPKAGAGAGPGPVVATRPPAAAGLGAWGWNRPGLLTRAESAPSYLNHLADAAGEWFDETPATPDELARRLGALRTGCTRLIVADHASLKPADREWLVERCRVWAGKLDDSIHALELGEPFDRVRAEPDATVRKLIGALRDRARSVA